MRLHALTLALAATALLASPARADTVLASQDTFVTLHNFFGGPGSVHGNDTTMQVIGGPPFGSEQFTARTLVQFDLGSYAGQTVQGDATLSMYLAGYHQFAGPANFSIAQVHLVTQSWNEATATWNNQPTGFTNGVIAEHTFTPPSEANSWVSWTLSASVVQSWINNPGTNFGILIESEPGTSLGDLTFRSSEYGSGNFGPTLTFQVGSPSGVPEPGTVALATVAGASMLVRRVRRKAGA